MANLDSIKRRTFFLSGLICLITGLYFTSVSTAKIIRYKKPDGTIVMKSVPDDWVPPERTKSGSAVTVMKTRAKAQTEPEIKKTSDNQETDASQGSLTEKPAESKAAAKPASADKKADKLDKATARKFLDQSKLETEKITYMGLSAVLTLCLLAAVIVIIFMLKHYRRVSADLEEKLTDSQSRMQEQQVKHSSANEKLTNDMNDHAIQSRAVIQKLHSIASAANIQTAVQDLFHLIAMYDNQAVAMVYIKDFELDQIYAWKYFNISADEASSRVYSISDNCLMNLCMTRQLPLSVLDAESDTVIDRTINTGVVKCTAAFPLFDSTIPKACLCIENFSEGVEMDRDILNSVKAGTAILSKLLSVSGIYTLTREQVILGQIPGSLTHAAAPTSSESSSSASDSFLHRTVSDKIADQLRKYPDLIKHSSGIRKGTLVYARIDNFKAISENMEPFELIDYLNDFYESMKEIIFKYDGTIDTTSHGEIIAFWGGPITQKYHASMAAQACLRMSSVLKRRNSGALSNNLPQIKMGISISSGDLILGRIGPKNRCDYSVVGNELDVVRELQSFSGQYNVNIVLTGSTQEIIENEIETREIDMVKLFGRQTMLYHITGLKNVS